MLLNGGVSSDHYFSADPAAPEQRREVAFTVAGRELRLAASSGVFSASRLDPGTAVLLRKAPLPRRAGTYLDLGCGYGAIAASLATSAPEATVYAVDVNARALALVAENAASVPGHIVPTTPDAVPPDVRFDEIWSNPPIRVGKPALHEMLLTWLPRLVPGGTAWLVVARNLGADSLAGWLAGQGYEVDRQASQKGYRVLSCTARG